MKILIQHRHHPQEISGVMTYVNAMNAALTAQGIEVEIISTKTDSPQAWLKAIAQADIVHMNSNHLGFSLACKALGKKIIVKYHYLFYQSIHSSYEPLPLSDRLKTEFRYTLPKAHYPLKWKLFTLVKWARLGIRMGNAALADCHTACSQFLSESMAFHQPVLTLYNPISFDRDRPLKSLPDLKTPYTFAFVGRITKDKGIDILLKAAALVHQQGKNFHLMIIGDGSELPQLQQLATELKIQDLVQFLGKQPNAEVLSLLQQSLALVVPSRWQDPAPYVVMEAASVQTCPIVSQMGGLTEMIGEFGYSFKNEDIPALATILTTCLDSPQETLERGWQISHYVADRFSPEQAASELLQLCQELLNKSV